ncbi:unnamed protein product [Cylicocyclus nassatus]|uniref:MAGE domain-containing protein n=1 Tax=Cylicocyclus nassatus TaxID=53992 RepID=A0AA36GLV1_CYLNA|nr:unnamed protein product [Cylicocyclus nassatus]
MSSSDNEPRSSRRTGNTRRIQRPSLTQVPQTARRAGTQPTYSASQPVEILEEDERSSSPQIQVLNGSRTLTIRHLARHLLHASTTERDGALRNALAQKMHFLSKHEYAHALREASAVLQRSFGCKVVQNNNQSHVVRDQKIEQNYPQDTLAQAKRGLLSAILMFIFVSKSKKSNISCVTESMLLSFLSGLGLNYDKPDPVFGDIKKLISPAPAAEFIHEGYISFAKSTDRSETQVFTYDWGPRALLICEPKDILKSFCTIVKDDDVASWTDQQETVKLTEKELQKILSSSEQYLRGRR